MQFTHHIVQIPVAIQTEIEGIRYYQTPEGKLYPSITTVLSKTSDMSGLDEWRERIGTDAAEQIMKDAQIHGTMTHKLCEDYLNNKESNGDFLDIPKNHFEKLKPYLHKMNNIQGIELPLFSDEFKIAGTCDCIAEYNGDLSIIDFKTSRSRLMEHYDKVQKYFMQATAYSLMWKERTGIDIDQIVIIGSEETGDIVEFIKIPFDFKEVLIEKIEEFHKLGTTYRETL
ncbi:PD-(D/E)XK nuclease family protein [Candidatus Nitrosarchaeum limnium]|uniref:PD-(D/E)XK nuclease family protein n=1 Tax=Candidatus Nitrosarchaeum limnium TaxID=1007084 RepID=UPI001EE63EBC|nr:PD-(D/E)XK nuclease family protein [Candidatus Nitrosarchaeum limnium]